MSARFLGIAFASASLWPWTPNAVAQPRVPFATQYKNILARASTPSRFVTIALEMAKRAGFRELDAAHAATTTQTLRPGDRVALAYRGLTLALVIIGARGPSHGVRIAGAHIDAPHLRIQPHAVGRQGGTAVFRALAYGGVKRFHWLGRALQLVGDVHARGGRVVPVELGPRDGFVFLTTPLVGSGGGVGIGAQPRHGFSRRPLDVIAATVPPARGAPGGDPLRGRIFELLSKRFGVGEEDLRAANLSLVPAEPPRDVGLDRALVGAAGQDDRASAATALLAAIDAPKTPPHTLVAYFADREETGSLGTTGARSDVVAWIVRALLKGTGAAHDEDALRRALALSEALSADGPAALNPLFPSVFDRRNAARLGRGVAITKYSGSHGKLGGHDASAEMMSRTLARLRKAGVPVQVNTFGRVDAGGGGTIAQYLARRGIDVVDIGVPVLSMHSPFEIAAYADLEALVRAFIAFWTGD